MAGCMETPPRTSWASFRHSRNVRMRSALAAAVCLAALWAGALIGCLRVQQQSPKPVLDAPHQPVLKNSKEWMKMITFWEEVTVTDWSEKSRDEWRVIEETGKELAESLRPLEDSGVLEPGTVDAVLKDVDEECVLRSTLDPPVAAGGPNQGIVIAEEVAATNWKSLAEDLSRVAGLRHDGKLNPWACVALVTRARNRLAVLEGKYRESLKLGSRVEDQPAVSEVVRRHLKAKTLALVSSLEANGTLDGTAEKPVEPSQGLKEEIGSLIVRLGHDSFAEREKAQLQLVEIGEPALGQLREALKSEDAEVKSRARTILELFGEPVE